MNINKSIINAAASIKRPVNLNEDINAEYLDDGRRKIITLKGDAENVYKFLVNEHDFDLNHIFFKIKRGTEYTKLLFHLDTGSTDIDVTVKFINDGDTVKIASFEMEEDCESLIPGRIVILKSFEDFKKTFNRYF